MRAADGSSSVSEHDSQCMQEGTGIPSGGGCCLRLLPWPPPVGLCPAWMRHALAGVFALFPSGAVRMILSWPPAVVPLLRVHPGGRGFSDACRRCSADACAGVATPTATSPGAGVAGATGAGRAAATGSSRTVVAVAAAAAPHRAAGRTGTCGSSIGGGTNGDGMRIGGRTRRRRGGASCSHGEVAAAGFPLKAEIAGDIAAAAAPEPGAAKTAAGR